LHHLSLCSGIGGFDLGLRRVWPSLRTVAHVEGETFCVQNLVSQMQAGGLDACPIFPDLCRLPWDQFAGLVDVVSGGFPCQPFSTAGKRKGTKDERHLWPYIVEGLRTVRPKVAVFENVAGIATSKSEGFHSVLHHVLCDLEELGYVPTAGQFTAAEVGAPHLRKRWFILGLLRDTDSDSQPNQPVHDEAPRMQEHGVANAGRNPKAARRERASSKEGSRERATEAGSGRHVGPGHIKATGETWDLANTESFDGGGRPFDKKDREKLTTRRKLANTNDSGRGAYFQPSQLRPNGFVESSVNPWNPRETEGREEEKWPKPPGPTQYEWEPPRTIEPGVGGNAYGVSNRVDRLRALGNAVVPAVVERAVRELLARYPV
jgi:DNA (cytosine-5)-methyltransferase 1